MNLGTKGCEAARALNTSEHFAIVLAALKDLANQTANTALDSPPSEQARACGYARALRDTYVALEAARVGTHQNAIKKPGVKE